MKYLNYKLLEINNLSSKDLNYFILLFNHLL